MQIPVGFRVGAVEAGIKKAGLDLGLICSDEPALAAAVFTSNAFPAAPIILARKHLKETGGRARAVLVNSGNANAATGADGLSAARMCAEHVAREIGCRPEEVLVSSTGVIGRPLPTSVIIDAVPGLVKSASADHADLFSRAIMTTDTVPKIATAEFGGARILGFAKGAGMIHPNMATMLCFILTDARVRPADLKSSLDAAVQRSFNSISVDGDTSTNDTVLVLANGASGVAPRPEVFASELERVCEQLAKAIVRDGEGASKFIELLIEGAPSEEAARQIGRRIAISPLVKTAIYGCDPNWGRLIAAIGNSGVALASEQIDLYIDDIPLMGGDLKAASERMNAKEVRIRVSLHSGTASARVWTCDFTEEYIRINADYTT